MVFADTSRLLSRLLRRQAVPLLETFESLMPGRGLALVEQDGSLVARAGPWPEAALAQLTAPGAVSRQLGAARTGPVIQGECRLYPLLVDDLLAGGLAVIGEPPDKAYRPELVLQRSLELLMTQAMERRAIVDDTLNRYRELNLLYRVGETIGTALDPELIPQLVLNESRRVIPADVGVEVGLFLERVSSGRGEYHWVNKASFGSTEQVSALLELMRDQIERLLDKGQPAIITELPHQLSACMPRYRATLWAPLKTPQKVLGGILLGRLWDQPVFTANDEKLLTSLAQQSALALENAQWFAQTDEKLARRVQELTTLQRIDRQLNETLDYEHVLMLTAEFAASPKEVQWTRLLLPADGSECFRVAGHYPADLAGQEEVDLRQDSFMAWVAQSRQPQSGNIQEGTATYTRLGVPIWRKESVIGLLEAVKQDNRAFEAETVTFLTQLADHSALAIENTRLYAAAQQEIARRKKVEGQLRQHAVALKARNAELDAFAHTVAHDLKAPLSIITGFADMLESFLETMSTEELRKHLNAIVQNGRTMNNIIDELLLLAGVRKEQVDLSPLNMATIVANAQGRLAYLIQEEQAEIVLPETWPVALGYGPWIEEVWTNYLSNAIKYGGQRPSVEVGTTLQEDSMICFWIRDNGPGLDSEEQSRLFIPFTKLNQVEVKGHGLGLSIVRRIIERLGGQVGVESQVGQGSTFYFTLPAAHQPEEIESVPNG